jgi:signal transduction histidine kinase/signal recognition particle receptor subunit beta
VVDINHREKFVRAKIIYYGPAAGGKTTNLQSLHKRALPDRKLELVSVNTAQDRTILFDLLPLKTPAFRSYELRFQVIAVPGQRLYAATRKMLLKGADSIVFVANSATDRWTENLESLKEMTQYLLDNGIEPGSIPVVFQYNKRDLPFTTDLKVMDRALNARGSESFPAVAINEEGVLETFAAILRRTMADLSTRYKIGENIRDARSAIEWTERTMRETFAAKPEERPRPPEAPPSPPEPPRPATVVRVSTPSIAPPAANPAAPSAAAEVKDPRAAEALVESYAEAASDLAAAMAALREERDEARRKLEEIYAVTDAARGLLSGEKAEPILLQMLQRISKALGTSRASLSLQRPEGKLEPVALHGLIAEPLHTCLSPGGRPLASALLESGKPYQQSAEDSGPLSEAIDRAGDGCVGLVVIPLRTANRSIGLLAFYLGQESPMPSRELIEHLQQVAIGLAITVEVASGAIASERLERTLKAAFTGQVAERAIRASYRGIQQLQSALGRLRMQSGAPPWLIAELGLMEAALLELAHGRQAVIDFSSGHTPLEAPTAVDEVLAELESDFAKPLADAGIRFAVERKAGLIPVRADPVLLRAALHNLVENARASLSSFPQAGVIRVFAQPAEKAVRISVFDNASVLRAQSARSGYLAWPIERRLAGVSLGLARSVVEHYKGQWAVETREGKGTMVFIVLPTVG